MLVRQYVCDHCKRTMREDEMVHKVDMQFDNYQVTYDMCTKCFNEIQEIINQYFSLPTPDTPPKYYVSKSGMLEKF